MSIEPLLSSLIDPGSFMHGTALAAGMAAACLAVMSFLKKQTESSRGPFIFFASVGGAAYMGWLNSIAQ